MFVIFTVFTGQNLLCSLPETFGNLCSLRICQLSKNHIKQLPSSIGQLSKLEDLRLDHNKVLVKYLTESICLAK